MIHRNAGSLCLLTVVTANALLIGAAGLEPKMPQSISIVAMPLPPSPPPTAAATNASVQPLPFSTKKQTGVASWYGNHWQGREMASGKPFDDRQLTAAHRTLPLNTLVRVTNLHTGLSVDVTITDRGPYVHGRVIDLSEAAAQKLGMVKKGLVPVQITTIVPPATRSQVASLDVQ